MSVPFLTPFQLPNNIYLQGEFFPLLLNYFSYGKNYNNNLGQFATLSYQVSIEDYIVAGNNYLDLLLDECPIPHATPWNIYNPFSTPPAPPITTGWPQSQIDIIEAITDCLSACLSVANKWIDFIVTNARPPSVLTKERCWQITQDQYVSKLIKQYQDKPVATSTIGYYTYWYLLNSTVILNIIRQYNPWSAQGVMLDFIGSLYGLDRNISFKDGLNNEYTTLTDSQFRILIFFFITCWNCNFSYMGLATAIYSIFNSQINISSKQDMSITYYIKAIPLSDMYIAIYALLAINGLPSPLGVSAKFVSIVPIDKPFFALARASEQVFTTSLGWGFCNSSNYTKAVLLGYGNFIEV